MTNEEMARVLDVLHSRACIEREEAVLEYRSGAAAKHEARAIACEAGAAALRREQWRDIKDAPKDGWFWIRVKQFGVRLGRRSLDPEYTFEFFEPNFAGHETHHLNAVVADDVTHYRELPAPPEGV